METNQFFLISMDTPHDLGPSATESGVSGNGKQFCRKMWIECFTFDTIDMWAADYPRRCTQKQPGCTMARLSNDRGQRTQFVAGLFIGKGKYNEISLGCYKADISAKSNR